MFVHRISSNKLRRVGLGSSGVFFVGGAKNENQSTTTFVFKPTQQDNSSSRIGLKQGDGMIREIAAYEIDRQSSPILRAGVPRTVMACAGRSIGSLQSYVFLLFSLSHTHTLHLKKNTDTFLTRFQLRTWVRVNTRLSKSIRLDYLTFVFLTWIVMRETCS